MMKMNSTQWQNNLKGGYRVESIRPTGDPIRPWQGEVTVGVDDVQTWTWTAEGQYYAFMTSEYDLEMTQDHEVGVASARWGQCRCGKRAETETQVGWDPKANYGAGGGQYEQVCWDCRHADEARARDSHWVQPD